MNPNIFIQICNNAISTLTQNNEENTKNIYNALDGFYKQLEHINPQNETPLLLYAHCMYFAAIAERYWKYFDFEKYNFAAINIILLAEHCYTLFQNDIPLEALLIRNRHALVSSRVSKTIDRIGEKKTLCQCALCRNAHPDKKNSHLIPQMIINHLVNFKPSSERGFECIIEENDAMTERRLYFGRDINNDIIDSIGLRPRTEEEIQIAKFIPNPATRDHIFCTHCEDRFTGIETKYKAIQESLKRWSIQQSRLPLHKRTNPIYDYRIPYLFWLSVIWRMSVGNMAIKLSLEEEEKIRTILDKCLIDKRTVDADKLNEDDFCFYYTHELCFDYHKFNEPVCITGRRDNINPHVIIVGNHIICFYSDLSVAQEMRKKNLIPPILNGTEPEIVSHIPFRNIWERLYWIRFKNVVYNQKHLGECDIKDIIKYTGSINPTTISPLPLAYGDHLLLTGTYPLVVAWNLVPFLQTLNNNPKMPISDLAKGSIYSASDLEFMLATYSAFNKQAKEELQEYYQSKNISQSQPLPLTFAEYDHQNFSFYEHFPLSIKPSSQNE